MLQLVKKEDIKYEIAYPKENETSLESHYRAQVNSVIETYNAEIIKLNAKYTTDKEVQKNHIQNVVNNITYNYVLNSTVINDKYHHYVQRIANIPSDLTKEQLNIHRIKEAIKTIDFIGFTIVNAVYITSRLVGGNHIFFKNGELLTGDECIEILAGQVPERLLTTKAEF